MKEQVKDGNVVEDSVSEYGDAMSSSSDSEDQDVAETPNGTQQNGEDLYEPLPLNSQNVKMPIRNLQDSETELWLVQVPRHQTLRESLKGSNVNIGSDSSEKTGLRNSNRKAGVFKGSYIFRDMGNHPVEGLRASFVCESEEGKSKLELGKPFAKWIRVTFDTPLKDLKEKKPPQRSYPLAPDGLKLKYFPIGSTRDASRRTCDGGKVPGQKRASNENGFVVNSTKKARLARIDDDGADSGSPR